MLEHTLVRVRLLRVKFWCGDLSPRWSSSIVLPPLTQRPNLEPQLNCNCVDQQNIVELMWYAFLKFIYLFLERGEGKERERNINVWLPLVRPLLGT